MGSPLFSLLPNFPKRRQPLKPESLKTPPKSGKTASLNIFYKKVLTLEGGLIVLALEAKAIKTEVPMVLRPTKMEVAFDGVRALKAP